MDEPSLSESAWVRGWANTVRGLGAWQFWVLEVFGGGLMAILVSPTAALIFVLGMVVAMWIGATAISPIHQRNELRQYFQNFREAKKQKINVNWRFRSNRFAEMILTNISSETLPRVNLSFRNYRKPDGSDVKDILCDMIPVGGQEPSTKLDPLVQTFYRFATIAIEENDRIFILLTPSMRSPIKIEDREVGVKLALSGEHLPSQPIVLRLTLNDDRSLSIEPWEIGENAVRPAEVT